MRVIDKKIGNTQVLRTVKSDGLTNTFTKHNMYSQAGFNTSQPPRWAKYNFGSIIPRIVIHVRWGSNDNLMQEFFNVSEVTVDLTAGVNGNGGTIGQTSSTNFGIYFFISNPELVENMVWTTSSGNTRTAWGTAYLSERFINLKFLSIARADTLNNLSNIALPTIQKLIILGDNTSTWNATAAGFTELKHLTLGVFFMDFSQLPTTLRFLDGSIRNLNIDLKNFFINTNRMGLRVTALSSLTGRVVYTGGAIFPPHIFEEPEMPISVIFEIYNLNTIYERPSPDMVSQFLIDFANQVLSVTLVNKRIAFTGCPPNTDFTDNSKPLYKTYQEAYNYIRYTLGVTITF
ncbi:hypothetical protein [Chryseobacterium sp. R2A-55]|uniref:hypothetical protein n=1 Tax=Chryseobacterium sp. R2A-55 TaxID=2744445 RepID=UPI001F1A1576|nr:hypothetical protein [Chryseobacterium sp. R2A-55]